jgi:Peptidase family C25
MATVRGLREEPPAGRVRPARLLLAAPRERVGELRALIDTYRARGVDVDVWPYAAAMPDAAALAVRSLAADAVLLAGPSRVSPRRALPGPLLKTPDGRRLPAGWLPLGRRGAAARFCETAARVHGRRRERRSVAVFGQWHPRYLRLADRIGALLVGTASTWRWTSDVLDRDDLMGAVGTGLGLGIYLGHGRPVGWVGYRGLRARHFDRFDGEPLGAVVALACETASRRRTSTSFAEALPLAGVAAASFGAVMPTRHTDNTRWAVGLCEAVCAGATTIGELIARSAPQQAAAAAAYRIIGDPLAPIVSDHRANRRARAIPVFS